MPPRKRAKTAHVASPTPPSQAKTPTPAAESRDNADEQLRNDPWTDEEEVGLFKSLIKYKPTGIHKHFRLLAVHQFLLDNNYIHPKAEHTKPAGIWRKLETLYQLQSLDERENARQLEKVEIPEEYRSGREGSGRESSASDEDADAYSEAANKIDNDDFDLGGEEFGKMKWARRLPEDGDEEEREASPAELPDINMAREPPVRFTPSFSIEPSENATPIAKRGRGRASTAAAKDKPKPAPAPANKRRSARQAGSVADEEEGKDEDDEDEQESEDEESEEEEESEESMPAPRSTRNAKGARGRGGTSTKTSARGRPKRK